MYLFVVGYHSEKQLKWGGDLNKLLTSLLVILLLVTMTSFNNASASSYPTLRYGSKGSQVKVLQNKLISIGYLKSKATGYFGKETLAAVIKFQRDNHIKASGIVASLTWNAINKRTSYKAPSTNPAKENPTTNIPINNTQKPSDTVSDFIERKAEVVSLKGKTVIIDPGHGFCQPGVVRNNVYEKCLTLDMGLRLKRILEEAGANVVMTRSTDGDSGEYYLYYRSALANKHVLDTEIGKLEKELDEYKNKLDVLGTVITSKGVELERLKESGSTQSSTSNIENEIADLMQQERELQEKADEQNNKINDLKEKSASIDAYINDPSLKSRVGIYSGGYSNASEELTEVFDLTNDKYQKDIVFISIHCNSTASSETTTSGIQVYVSDMNNSYYNQYYPSYNQIERDRFGECLIKELNCISPFSKEYYSLYRSNLSVLREHNLISALVEVGFVNNASDRTLLTNEQTREDVAFGMYKGIDDFFNEMK